MKIKPPFAFETAVGAIRLALEGSKDDETRLALVWTIVEFTEPNNSADTNTVAALLHALKAAEGKFEVVT